MNPPNNSEPSPDGQDSTSQDRIRTLEAQLSEVQATEQQAMALFYEAPVPYLLLNSQGRLQDVNAAGCALLGRTREALLGKRLGSFLAPDSQTAFDVLLRQVFDHGLK